MDYVLTHHARICRHLSRILHLGATGYVEEAKAALEAMEIELSKNEMQTHRVFDNFLFIKAIRSYFRVKMVKAYQ